LSRTLSLICLAANPAIDKTAEVAGLVTRLPNRLAGICSVPGGKGLNVARAAHTLGGTPLVVGLLGGHSGRWIRDQLAALGIRGRYVWAAEGETRTCLSVRDAQSGDLIEFTEPGPLVSPALWSEIESKVRASLLAGADLLTLSGSLPPGAPTDAYARLCDLAAKAGARAVVDARGAPAERALRANPWLVKVNLYEAADLTGMPSATATDAVTIAHELVRAGAAASLVTLGSDGAILVANGSTYRLQPAPVVGAYPVGSGDALLGALCVALAQGRSLPDALQQAAGAAIANAQTRGAGAFAAADARVLAEQVCVEEMAS
jgi:tagatose 6-phosphate kinase